MRLIISFILLIYISTNINAQNEEFSATSQTEFENQWARKYLGNEKANSSQISNSKKGKENAKDALDFSWKQFSEIQRLLINKGQEVVLSRDEANRCKFWECTDEKVFDSLFVEITNVDTLPCHMQNIYRQVVSVRELQKLLDEVETEVSNFSFQHPDLQEEKLRKAIGLIIDKRLDSADTQINAIREQGIEIFSQKQAERFSTIVDKFCVLFQNYTFDK